MRAMRKSNGYDVINLRKFKNFRERTDDVGKRYLIPEFQACFDIITNKKVKIKGFKERKIVLTFF
jgi:hypothetical protein